MTDYRKIYSDYYGISISSEHAIHHIDGDRSNNRIDNLLLLPRDLHSKYHFYKSVVDKWDKSTSIDALYFDTYTLDALQKFSEVCNECFKWYRMKTMLDMGASPECAGFLELYKSKRLEE